MDLSKASSISGDYKERKSPTNWETLLFAGVVFMDKTHSYSNPTVYMLKENALPFHQDLTSCNSASFSKEAFMFLGEVAAIDKKRKRILLENKNTIAYTYLIIVSGTKHVISIEDEEFIAGLQALIDALRVKSKIPNTFATNSQDLLSCKQSSTQHYQESLGPSVFQDDIAKIAHPSIATDKTKPKTMQLDAINKRLYEVQL